MHDFIVITGTRHWSAAASQEITNIAVEIGDDYDGCIIHGGATGVDTYAQRQWKQLCWPIPAPWWLKEHGASYREWGTIRNGAIEGAVAELLRRGKSGMCFAVPSAKSSGTWDCIKRMKRLGVTVDVRRVP